MKDPGQAWWTEPETLVFGKSTVGWGKNDDVFAGILPDNPPSFGITIREDSSRRDALSLGGPWGFYEAFREAHNLVNLPIAEVPEIAVKEGMQVYVPLVIRHKASEIMKVKIMVETPTGWKISSGQGEFSLPAEASTDLRVQIDTPVLPEEELRKTEPLLIIVRAQSGGQSLGVVNLRVLLRHSALPQ